MMLRHHLLSHTCHNARYHPCAGIRQGLLQAGGEQRERAGGEATATAPAPGLSTFYASTIIIFFSIFLLYYYLKYDQVFFVSVFDLENLSGPRKFVCPLLILCEFWYMIQHTSTFWMALILSMHYTELIIYILKEKG